MAILRWALCATVLLTSQAATAALHIVNVNSSNFSPANIQIEQGDQVRWQLVSGSHTTTSTSVPSLWDEEINSQNPTFTRTFNTVGSFPYRCTPHGFTGNITVEAASGILDDPADMEVPSLLALAQNSPNPFNAATQLRFSLDRDLRAQLHIYNILGQHVRTLFDELRPAGIQTVEWDGTDARGAGAASGIYFARLMTPDAVMTRKMVLLR